MFESKLYEQSVRDLSTTCATTKRLFDLSNDRFQDKIELLSDKTLN